MEKLYNKYNNMQLMSEKENNVISKLLLSKDPMSQDTRNSHINKYNKNNTIIFMCKIIKEDIVKLMGV